jgi:Secretion system C-terminal sorting domain
MPKLIFVKNRGKLLPVLIYVPFCWEGKMNISKTFRNLILAVILVISVIDISVYSQVYNSAPMDINNITSWILNDGFHPAPIGNGGVAGTFYNGTFPKGTAGGVYTEGINWGGLVFDGNNPLVRANGSTYFNGNYPLTRLYRVRSFYDKKYLRNDAANTFLVPDSAVTDSMINVIYLNYQKDWNQWPADKGAPFYDKNKDGKYEPDSDIPGVPGASQTIWISYDDRNSTNSYGSPPIGLEVHETYWAYADEDNLNNIIFKNAKIIYKGLRSSASDSYVDSMYIVNFSDIDVGAYYDDFIGCDTTLNLGYEYNSKINDDVYNKYFNSVPAIGYTFIHGVAQRTDNPLDSAIVDLKWKKGYKYFNSKPMTIYIAHRSGGSFSDPTGRSYNGTLEFYNFMRGYNGLYPNNYLFVSPNGQIGGYGTYMLPGDPVIRSGWIDGIDERPGDRRMWMVTGPFSLKLGDTADVSLALVGGLGIDNISSISVLRYYTKYAISAFNYLVDQNTSGGEFNYTPPQITTSNLPDHYMLSQNYPNPFNPTTTIEYELPKDAFVKLVVYDILGREIRTLVNQQKAAGSYKVIFDGSNLSSGVYFYRITFTNSDSKLANDNLSRVNKLMLIK